MLLNNLIALGSLSRRESRKDLWALLLLLITLCYTTNLHSSNAARRCKMLVFDRLGLLSILAILQSSPQIQPLHLIPMHK